MPATYTTRDGDMLDRICFDHYGTVSVIVAVYEANPGLAKKGIVLPAGVTSRARWSLGADGHIHRR